MHRFKTCHWKKNDAIRVAASHPLHNHPLNCDMNEHIDILLFCSCLYKQALNANFRISYGFWVYNFTILPFYSVWSSQCAFLFLYDAWCACMLQKFGSCLVGLLGVIDCSLLTDDACPNVCTRCLFTFKHFQNTL